MAKVSAIQTPRGPQSIDFKATKVSEFPGQYRISFLKNRRYPVSPITPSRALIVCFTRIGSFIWYVNYSQLIWKSSTRLGCGMASIVRQDGSRDWYMVARYSPPGNFVGDYTNQVARPVSNGQY